MDIDFDIESWRWSVLLIVVTVTFHATGVVSMALGMITVRLRLEGRNRRLRSIMPAVMGLVAVIGLLLTVLHGIEAAIWAAAYFLLGTFAAFSDAMPFRSAR